MIIFSATEVSIKRSILVFVTTCATYRYKNDVRFISGEASLGSTAVNIFDACNIFAYDNHQTVCSDEIIPRISPDSSKVELLFDIIDSLAKNRRSIEYCNIVI